MLVREFCPQCHEVQIGANDGECPVCGCNLEVTPGSIRDTMNSENASDEHINILQSLLNQMSDTSDVSISTRNGASDVAIEALQRLNIGDARCSALHEVVLELFDCSQEVETQRIFMETQIAGFSHVPTPMPVSSNIVIGNPIEGDKEFENESRFHESIVLLKRGKVSFVTKALRAQKAGARAVIIIQTVDVWPYTMQDSKGESKGIDGDDRHPALHIPVVMIKKEDGQMLLERSVGCNEQNEKGTIRVKLHVHDIETQCSICQDEYAVNSLALRLPCRHHFHDSCIRAWFAKNNTCPICRYELEDKEGSNTDRNRSNQTRDETYLSWFC